jgi:hypothetical protein
MAKVPAAAPGPNTATKISAQTSEFTDRDATRRSCADPFSTLIRQTFRAASSASGIASRKENSVPSVAMCSVSTIAACTDG